MADQKKVERTTAAILNEPFEICGIPRVPAAIVGLIVICLWLYVAWKMAAVAFIGLTLSVKQLYRWDRDFLLLIPAIIFFFIHRVFDPFEWEPFGLVIVEDARYEED